MKAFFLSVLLYGLSSLVLANSLQKGIDTIIQHNDPHINLGMMVMDLHTGATLYQRNIKQSFIPASNMKLFSDAAALLALGPDYHFISKLATDATSIEQGTLNGSLYLYLSGDPSFNQKHLAFLLHVLPQLGVRHITGSVILVSPLQHLAMHPPGVLARDENYSYGASLSPLICDENRVTVTVNPSCRLGEPALIEYSAPHHSFILDNHVRTVADNRAGISIRTTEDNHLAVNGNIGQGQAAIQAQIPIKNPLAHTQELIKLALQEYHIVLDGRITLGTPHRGIVLATHYSKPIVQLIADTLKPSDNLYADSLFLHAASQIQGHSVDWQEAQTVLKNYLAQQTGIDMQSAALIDGSGLSRHDLLTPEQTVGLLYYLYHRFPLAYEYIAALPIAGQDGTLQRRFKHPGQKGLIRAKTGSMTGVVSLSGYLYTANAHTLAFAIFINTRPQTPPHIAGRYRSMVDSICGYLLKQKPETSPNHAISLRPYKHPLQQSSYAEKRRARVAKWRRIEHTLKQSLQGGAYIIVFRGNHVIIQDNNADPKRVLPLLQKIAQQDNIGIVLNSARPIHYQGGNPPILWLKTSNTQRGWALHETIG